MTSDAIIIPITMIEEFHLARLVDDFLELVDTSRDSDDPAIDRLTPSPYPDDADSAAEFSDSTRSDLLDRRLLDARRMRRSLRAFEDGVEPLESEALTTREIAVAADELDSWLRTLTAVRLVIATRLGITAEDESEEDGRHDVYDWLGYRLELLIQAADEADAAQGR